MASFQSTSWQDGFASSTVNNILGKTKAVGDTLSDSMDVTDSYIIGNDSSYLGIGLLPSGRIELWGSNFPDLNSSVTSAKFSISKMVISLSNAELIFNGSLNFRITQTSETFSGSISSISFSGGGVSLSGVGRYSLTNYGDLVAINCTETLTLQDGSSLRMVTDSSGKYTNITYNGGGKTFTATGSWAYDGIDTIADLFSANDTFNGTASNDYLQGYVGNDTLNGGAGSDTAVYTGRYSASTITKTATGFTVKTANEGTDVLNDMEFARFSDQTVNLSQITASVPGTPVPQPSTTPKNLKGTANNETLEGGSANDTLDGGEGNDVLVGGAGNDKLYGGKGTDTAQYAGFYANFTVTALYEGKNGVFSGYQVKDNSGAEGLDVISTDVEFLTFGNNQTKIALNSTGTTSVVFNNLTPSANVINGSDSVDNLVGTPGIDNISAGGGNDLISASAGNDTIDGGAGIDTLSYTGLYTTFTAAAGTNGAVTLTSTKYNTDTLRAIERIKFTDKCFANDVSGSAGHAAKVITAAFGKDYVPQFLAIGLTLADSGQSVTDLCQTISKSRLVESIAGVNNTLGYVEAIYKNVVGRAPNVLESNSFVNMIDSGTISRQDLLLMAAQHSMVSETVNSLNVSLMGIAYDPGF
ncbi:DUF4214 domain-containing protein [Limnohabitans sp.]|uniref:DUF4214 domain-containing protein n=1 Tax=Limnohabitans sp. TaxID=1907725 RepID=UPI002AFFF865|nr:DUF4214 domain-containing protein [Limnohabitans sp.]